MLFFIFLAGGFERVGNIFDMGFFVMDWVVLMKNRFYEGRVRYILKLVKSF